MQFIKYENYLHSKIINKKRVRIRKVLVTKQKMSNIKTLNTKVIATVVGVSLALSLLLGVSVQLAGAQSMTLAQLVDLFISLGIISSDKADAARAAVSSSMTTSSFTFTRDLTVGSMGADVTALQNKLGVSPATGYFGSITKAAVMQYQGENSLPTTGYFGPLTRAKMNASAMVSTAPSAPSAPSTVVVGMTGSGEGYLDDIKKLSAISGEEVGESQRDVKVLGVEMEANDGDQKLDRVIVTITRGSGAGSSQLERYVTDASVWLDGQLLGRMNVLDASRNRTTNEYTFRFTGLNGVVKKGAIGNLYVAVSGVSNVDSGDTYSWTTAIPINGIRAVSSNGTDDFYHTGAFTETFTVADFGVANAVKLVLTKDNASPKASTVEVHASNDTDGVTLLVFNVKAEGSDITIVDLPVFLTVGGAATDADQVVSRLTLTVGGKTYSESVVSTTAVATALFDDMAFTITEGSTATFVVKGDINDLETTLFQAGDTLKAEIGSIQRNAIIAEDETGDQLTGGELTGTSLGDVQSFRNIGPIVTFVSASATVTAGTSVNDDTGAYVIKFRVEAFGDTIYVSQTAAATVASLGSGALTNGIIYQLNLGSTATVTDPTPSALVTFTTANGAVATTSSAPIELTIGEFTEVTLTVSRTNNSSDDVGLYQMLLRAIGWNTTAGTTFTLYTFDLGDYKTSPIALN